jgi:deoxycytidylate deaminase
MEIDMDSQDNPEIIIGLIGAVGTDLVIVSSVIKSILSEFNYSTDDIRLSELIRSIPYYQNLIHSDSLTESKRINDYMDAGDDLRRISGRADILSLLSTMKIKKLRAEYNEKNNQEEDKPIPRHAFILKSLKHPSEIRSLKDTYGKSFLALSIYSPRKERLEKLSNQFAATQFQKSNAIEYRSEAEILIEKDAKSGVDEYGQNVSEAFPEADVFIELKNNDSLRRDLKRLLEVWFKHPFRTPTIDEYGMFHAKAASLRSSDLSRQVGAVVTSDRGEILSAGCNEVPRPGGGLYWEGDENDDRDFQIGYDSSAQMKEQMVGEILDRLKKNQWLNSSIRTENVQDLVNNLLYGKDKSLLKGTRVSSIIEFGRIVHAEMAAITEAARRGISLNNATLYCTTYPCHMCARHIIAAGIKRVVFIEPYPKSMTKELYNKAIVTDNECSDSTLVKFDSFVGIAPNRYVELFSMKARKDSRGNALTWEASKAYPSAEQTSFAYIEAEKASGLWISESEEMKSLLECNTDFWQPTSKAGAQKNDY